MEGPTMNPDDLFRILNQAAGADGAQADAAELLDINFADLGYDSLALLEAIGAIEREYELSLPDSVAAAPTPREMLLLVSAAR
jgi:minimal PKS acyl carrier protein